VEITDTNVEQLSDMDPTQHRSKGRKRDKEDTWLVGAKVSFDSGIPANIRVSEFTRIL